jgi:hypothetical protein
MMASGINKIDLFSLGWTELAQCPVRGAGTQAQHGNKRNNTPYGLQVGSFFQCVGVNQNLQQGEGRGAHSCAGAGASKPAWTPSVQQNTPGRNLPDDNSRV